MMPKLTRIAVFSITILIGTLISDYISAYFVSTIGKTYKGVAINMIATVVVFYPLFSLLEYYVKKASKRYIQKSKSVTGNSFLGLIIGFTLAILVLFMMFASVWYNLNVLSLF